MEGEVEQSDNDRSFSSASMPKKMAIVASGAIVNIVFAIAIYFILMFSQNKLVSNQVNEILEGYTAEQLGLQEDDYILEINGEKTKNFYDITNIISSVENDKLELVVNRDDEIIEYTGNLTEVTYNSAGIYVDEDLKILLVEKGKASDGLLQDNDTILKVNGIEIEVFDMLYTLIQEAKDEIIFEVKRNGEIIEVTVLPEIIPQYYIGIIFKEAPDTFVNKMTYAHVETNAFLKSIFENLKMLFTGEVGVNQMTGPIGISTMVADTDGIKEFVYLLALISLSLGVTNLLPIPALDGGKLLILTIEAIRKKPIKEELEIKIQMLGIAIIIGLTFLVTYNDVIRLIK